MFRPAGPAEAEPAETPNEPEAPPGRRSCSPAASSRSRTPRRCCGSSGAWQPERPGLDLVLVGDGRLRAGLEAAIAGTALAGRVRFAGHLPRAEMPALYRTATVLAVTSRHEGQSMVTVEAAASGLPIVGTRVGVLPDMGDAVTTVPVGDDAALADALAAVLDDLHRAARMAAAGRSVAVARFDLERTTDDLLERYAGLVRRDGVRGRRR